MTAAHVWDVFRFDGFDLLNSDPRQQRRIVTAPQRRVRLLRRTKIIFHAEMNLNFTTRKPAASALGQFGWFCDFRHAKYVDKKATRRLLAARWHGELHVIDVKKRIFRQGSAMRLSRLQ